MNQNCDFEPRRRGSLFSCKFCDYPNLQWFEISPETWRPYDTVNKKIHNCKAREDNLDKELALYREKNISDLSLDTLLQKLIGLGFMPYVPRTSSWKLAMVKSSDFQTVYFLIGRMGIDFKIYDYVRELEIDNNNKIYTDSGQLVRNYYWKSEVNIHKLIMRIANCLASNILVDASMLSGQGESLHKHNSKMQDNIKSDSTNLNSRKYDIDESDNIMELYDAMSHEDGEDAYMGDGIWIGSDGSIYDRGR